MSLITPRSFMDIQAEKAHFVLIEGRFYTKLNDMLIAGAKARFEQAGASCEVVSVPGALEIPIAMAMLQAQSQQGVRKAIDGFVAIGVVIRGETTHYETVSQESARGCMDVASRHHLAFGNAILTVEHYEQALVRADPLRGNKGAGAAEACLSLYALKQ